MGDLAAKQECCRARLTRTMPFERNHREVRALRLCFAGVSYLCSVGRKWIRSRADLPDEDSQRGRGGMKCKLVSHFDSCLLQACMTASLRAWTTETD